MAGVAIVSAHDWNNVSKRFELGYENEILKEWPFVFSHGTKRKDTQIERAFWILSEVKRKVISIGFVLGRGNLIGGNEVT